MITRDLKRAHVDLLRAVASGNVRRKDTGGRVWRDFPGRSLGTQVAETIVEELKGFGLIVETGSAISLTALGQEVNEATKPKSQIYESRTIDVTSTR